MVFRFCYLKLHKIKFIKNFKYFYIDIGITIIVSLQALTIWEILYRILPYRCKCTQ